MYGFVYCTVKLVAILYYCSVPMKDIEAVKVYVSFFICGIIFNSACLYMQVQLKIYRPFTNLFEEGMCISALCILGKVVP